jgi:hypothetical protein
MIVEVDDLPKTLDETYDFLNQEKFGNLKEWLEEDVHDALGKAHHGLGTWIRNNLKLWEEKSNLKEWFIENYFLDHPDDISAMILVNFHQRKNGLIPNLNKEAERYHKHWEKIIPNYKLKLRKFKLNKLCSGVTK